MGYVLAFDTENPPQSSKQFIFLLSTKILTTLRKTTCSYYLSSPMENESSNSNVFQSKSWHPNINSQNINVNKIILYLHGATRFQRFYNYCCGPTQNGNDQQGPTLFPTFLAENASLIGNSSEEFSQCRL